MGRVRYKNTIVFLIVVILALGILFFMKAIPEENHKDESVVYNHDWYYLQGSEKIPIALPHNIQLKDNESFAIYNDDIASDSIGSYVYVKNAIYRPEIYLDDVPLYFYNDGGLRRNPPELSYQICKGKIKDNVEAGTVKIIYHKSDNDVITLPEVYVGSTDSIVKSLFLSNAYISVITITMIMLGIFVFMVGLFTLKQDYADKRKLLYLGILLFLMGTWCTTDSPLVQYLLGYSNINMNADFFIFLFLIIPFVCYIQDIVGMEKYKVLKGIIIAVLFNSMIQTILVLLEVFTFIQMVPITHLLIVIAVVVPIFLLCKEYKKNKRREVFLCLRSFAIFGGVAIISIIIYFLKPELFYQNLLQTGVLIFILTLIWTILTEFIASLQYKAEAKAYKYLAEVDKLTNLSNRRSFDLKIAEIEKSIEKYDNVLLIFIDVNGLKWINDSYGHAKGDETIVAVAHCIENAYKQQGACYRIGGDEFCVVIEDPLFSEEDAIYSIENQVANYNKDFFDDFYCTVAVGCSFLKENGMIKTITDWKEEADCKMYENKKGKKFKGKIL